MELKDVGAHAEYWGNATERLKEHLPDPEIAALYEIAEVNRINFTAEFLIRQAFEV